MTHRFKTKCPRCKREGEVFCGPNPVVNCGECLWTDVEIVQLDVEPIVESLGWIIVSTDADGARQYWNNGYGWVEQRSDATAFEDRELSKVALPIGGSWERYEARP